jgi:hypothetical protein
MQVYAVFVERRGENDRYILGIYADETTAREDLRRWRRRHPGSSFAEVQSFWVVDGTVGRAERRRGRVGAASEKLWSGKRQSDPGGQGALLASPRRGTASKSK